MAVKEKSLHTLLKDTLNDEELRTLCLHINVNYEDLPAEGRAGKMRELILYCEKNSTLPLLIDELKELRPRINWPSAARPLTLAQLIDEVEEPLLPFEPETVEIPAGSFIMGHDAREGIDDFETPAHHVHLERYWLGKFPVTNGQYERFIRETERPVPPEMGWKGRTPLEGQEQYPATAVAWHDALAYCEWLSEKTGKQYALPSEAQWERAARSTDGRIYPWGNVWEDGRCHWGNEGITAVDAFPPQNEDGFYDLVGNVRQWTSSLWGENFRRPDNKFRYPWSQASHDPDDITTVASHLRRIYRGCASSDPQEQCRCFNRRSYMPDKSGPPGKRHGFRVVLVKKSS